MVEPFTLLSNLPVDYELLVFMGFYAGFYG